MVCLLIIWRWGRETRVHNTFFCRTILVAFNVENPKMELNELWPERQRQRGTEKQDNCILWYKNYWCRKYHRLDSLTDSEMEICQQTFWGMFSAKNCEGVSATQKEVEPTCSFNKATSQSHWELWSQGGLAKLSSVKERGQVLCPVHQHSLDNSQPWWGSVTLDEATPLERRKIPGEGHLTGNCAGSWGNSASSTAGDWVAYHSIDYRREPFFYSKGAELRSHSWPVSAISLNLHYRGL